MWSPWGRLALAAGVLVNIVAAAGDTDKVVGARCDPGRKNTWGLWCEIKSECDGPMETRSNRCVVGQEVPPPRVVCCRKSGPAPPDEVAPTPTTTTTTPTTTTTTPTTTTTSRRDTTSSTRATPKPTSSPTANLSTTYLDIQSALKVAKKKCVEYSEYVYTYEESQSLLVNAERERVSRCPTAGQMLIHGGVLASDGEFPSMVALGYEPPGNAEGDLVWMCGGSLISTRFVLTAAHCLYHPALGYVQWAQLGANKLSNVKAQRINVEKAIKHPAYSPPSHYDDIALLKLVSEPTCSPEVRPACVGLDLPVRPLRRRVFGTPYDVMGWGLNSDSLTTRTEYLMKVNLYQASMIRCNEFFKFIGKRKLPEGIRPDSMLCIGNKERGKDSCRGDSGGPALTRLKDRDTFCMHNVAGITSFGENTCGGNVLKVSIFTRVQHYLPWIVSQVWPGEVA